MPSSKWIVLSSLILFLSLRPATANAQVAGATTVQLPTFGVAIDADGVLSVKRFPDPTGRLAAERSAAAKAKLAADVFAESKSRKISLVKLQQAVRAQLDAGKELDGVMRHLAGLQRVQHVFFYPKRRDIVIAGPAAGWMQNPSGRVVGVNNRRPVLLLEDLIVALRAYPPGNRHRPFLGCTIDPDPEGLSRLVKFQSRVPRRISQSQRAATANYVARGMKESLGMANIRVFGVSNRTHFAQVLIEADYRMKLIGIGLEPPPVKMATFISALHRGRHSTLQRWWFTPNYECVRVTEDGLAMELVGEGVILRSEDKLVGADGSLAATGATPNKASHLFTTSFTRKYPDISARSPVYTQLRNMIDLAIAAAHIRKQDYYGRAGWNLGVFADERRLPVETLDTPQQVQCAVNVVWKGSRMLAPAGGGVSIRPDQALEPDQLLPDENGVLAKEYEKSLDEGGAWWWD